MDKESIKRRWATPGDSIAFSGVNQIYKQFEGKLSVDKIKEALAEINAYTLNREVKTVRQYNPYLVFRKRELFQIDLIELGRLSSRNQNFRYILCCIDSLTRYLWCIPLKNKQGSTVANAFKHLLSTLETPPERCLHDKGAEFTSRAMKMVFSTFGINNYLPKTSFKAGTVGTLKSLII